MQATSDTSDLPGLAVAQAGLQLELTRSELPRGQQTELSFQIVGEDDGEAVTGFDVEHEKEMHLIVVRRDLTGFQHLHPTMSKDGTWSTPLTLPEAGSYRVFADFAHEGTSLTLGSDLAVDGDAAYRELPGETMTATTDSGYEVGFEGAGARAGEESELNFEVIRDGEPVQVEPYLGADGHLVALREGDLAFLHVHPTGQGIRFMTEFPTEGTYRLFLQFKHNGEVHTAAFTRPVSR